VKKAHERLSVTGPVTKEVIVRAQGGDFHLFENLDTDNNGEVSLLEWEAYINKTHNEKGPRKGPSWLASLLYSMDLDLEANRPDLRESQENLRTAIKGYISTVKTLILIPNQHLPIL